MTVVDSFNAPPSGYAVYANTRFGFRLAYPRSFKSSFEPDNGGGRSFTADSGKAFISACGSNLYPGQMLADEYVLALNGIRGTIAHRQITAQYFEIVHAISDMGEFNELILTKAFVGKCTRNDLLVRYALTHKEQFEPMLATVAKSFCPGNLDQAG
jgi:hypothetical protein